jgi:hypothetical protein
MGVFLSVADAIKTALNARSFSKEFTAARGYDTRLVLAELGLRGLVVHVCPGQLSSEDESRGDTLETATADIAIFYKFEQDDMADGKVKDASVDPYVDLLEEVLKYLIHPDQYRLPTLADAVRKSVVAQTPFVPEHLETHHQYTGILTATYEVSEAFA